MYRIIIAVSVLFFIFKSSDLLGQKIGVGAQFGEPTGLTLRVNSAGNVNLDMLAAWNLDHYFFFNLHGLWERPVIKDLPQFHYFYGPGAFVVLHDRIGNNNNDISLGISGDIGLNVYLGRVEIFGQLTPRLTLVKSTYGNIGGGLGGRFYFN